MTASKITSLGHVAVIGGCGFLGVNIVKLLAERYPDSKIAAVDIRTNVNRVENTRVSYHNVDISNAEAVDELFQKLKFDVVINTATLIYGVNGGSKEATYKVNVEGTQNLLAAAKQHGAKAFILTSSASVVVGDVTAVINVNEDWPVLTGKDQPEYYSETKAQSEIAVLHANRSTPNFLTCALRPAAIFGEHDNTVLLRTLMIEGGKRMVQIGPNDNLFDYTHVKNVAHAHLLAAEALLQTLALGITPLDTERVDGQAFFITNGTPVYFWDFIRRVWLARGAPEDKVYDMKKVFVLGTGLALLLATLSEVMLGVLGRKPNFTRLAVRNSAMTRYYDIEKARKRLKYEPIVSLEEGIQSGVRSLLADREKLKSESLGEQEKTL